MSPSVKPGEAPEPAGADGSKKGSCSHQPVNDRATMAATITQWVTRTGHSQTYTERTPVRSTGAWRPGVTRARRSAGAVSSAATSASPRAGAVARVEHVHRARHARVEGVDGPQELERPLGVGHRHADERLLVGPRSA